MKYKIEDKVLLKNDITGMLSELVNTKAEITYIFDETEKRYEVKTFDNYYVWWLEKDMELMV